MRSQTQDKKQIALGLFLAAILLFGTYQSAALINQLADEVAIASGAACSSGTIEPSAVLRAMEIEGDALYGAVRISFDRYHSHQEIATAVNRIVAAVRRMQDLAA